MEISAELVKKLREKSGAGIMDCKRALKEAEGDFDRANEILKELGLAAVAKRSGRSTEEGRIFTCVSADYAGIMEMSCETDFVARNSEFVDLGKKLLGEAVSKQLQSDSKELADGITQLASTVKENIALRRLEIIPLSENQLAVDYIHGDAGNLGVLIVLEVQSAQLLGSEAVTELARNLALHAAAFSPLFLDRSAIPGEYIAEQEKIYTAQAAQMDKPEKVLKGIVQGKLNKHIKEICFSDQAYVKDDSRTVGQLLKECSKELGSEIRIAQYRVFTSGEEL